MSNAIFDLEQEIMECWRVTNDIKTVTSWFVDSPDWEGIDPKIADALMNKYFAIQELYELKFDRLWYVFEQHAKEYHEAKKKC